MPVSENRIARKAQAFCSKRLHIHLPIFVAKIALILALAVVSAVFIVKTVVRDKMLAWQPAPLILIPGLMGSKLYVEGFGVDFSACAKDIRLRKLWMSEDFLDNAECEMFLLSLKYDQTSGQFVGPKNVEVGAKLRDVPFGSTLWPVQCTFTDFNPRFCDYSAYKGIDESYFRRMAEFLMKYLKYQIGKTLFAAQYDWRQHQNSSAMSEYYEDLRFLVEHTVNLTNPRKRAVLLGHSMGNIVINRFLREKVDEEWQKNYLEATINVAPPFGGAVDQIKGLLSGKDVKMNNKTVITSQQYVDFVKSSGFPANLMPFKNAFGSKELLKIGDRSFSADNAGDFLAEIGAGHLIQFYEKNEPTPQKHVPMKCVYGVGKGNTDLHFVYANKTDSAPLVGLGDGDGTVNVESLRVCRQWGAQGHDVQVTEIPDAGHTGILMQEQFYKYLASVLTSY